MEMRRRRSFRRKYAVGPRLALLMLALAMGMPWSISKIWKEECINCGKANCLWTGCTCLQQHQPAFSESCSRAQCSPPGESLTLYVWHIYDPVQTPTHPQRRCHHIVPPLVALDAPHPSLSSWWWWLSSTLREEQAEHKRSQNKLFELHYQYILWN